MKRSKIISSQHLRWKESGITMAEFISGTQEQVKQQLVKLANDFDVDEIIVTTMTYSYDDRIRSFELLAEAFELERKESRVFIPDGSLK